MSGEPGLGPGHPISDRRAPSPAKSVGFGLCKGGHRPYENYYKGYDKECYTGYDKVSLRV